MEEIFADVVSGAALTTNFHIMTVSASVIAGLGLGTNSSVMVVASMLISPLMGYSTTSVSPCPRTHEHLHSRFIRRLLWCVFSPIIALTYGMATGNASLVRTGFVNELIAATITVLCGGF